MCPNIELLKLHRHFSPAVGHTVFIPRLLNYHPPAHVPEVLVQKGLIQKLLSEQVLVQNAFVPTMHHLPTCLPLHLPNQLINYLPIYLPIYIPIYLPT